ncbi:unnamed protein product [Rotaria sp. Silwood2]|nr:unnamed protein product [Rotaria sp. Silwood2]CAF4648863.1 unnamed protein product [Rotaria sp. Silwood2]
MNTELIYENDNHNYNGNAVSIEIRLFKEKVRDRATNSNESTQAVIDNFLTNLSDHAVVRLPDFKHIKRNIQNRRGQNNLPEIPHDRTFNQIPVQLTTTKRNSSFLQYDSGAGNDRIIIFSSLEQLQLLENCEQLLVDGTFKVTPSIFYQLYALHVVYRNSVLPVVFALLPNKTEQTYRRLIDKLSELCPLWNPKYIMMDFEKSSINAFADKFTTTTNPSVMSGCFFHL